ISHSSVERVTLPDSFLVADFMADELARVVAGLRVDPVRMLANLEAGGGLVHSQSVLLALVDAGLPRDEAYRIVQRHALAAAGGRGRALRHPLERALLLQEHEAPAPAAAFARAPRSHRAGRGRRGGVAAGPLPGHRARARPREPQPPEPGAAGGGRGDGRRR